MEFDLVTWQWILVIVSSLVLILISPVAKTPKDFFKGSNNEKSPGFWLLTSSLVISWLFAKSITNAANLGLSFGIVGGVAYGVYYFSFLVAGVVLYKLRTRGGFTSIHHFLRSKFGQSAVLIFSVLIAFRLMNEVWSNTMVIGTYFGDKGAPAYYWSIVVFTVLTSIYTLKGGLRSSLLTDMIQMVLFVVLLVVILGFIFPKQEFSFESVTQSGSWTLSGGLNLLLVAFIQIFSYPFHDPVMTDRAFITDARTMLKGFIWAGIIGFVCIVLFSLVGVYGKINGVQGQAPVEVAKLLGVVMMLVVNFIMITSAASTLDSTFNSFAKLWVLDINRMPTPSIRVGRLAIVGILLIGTIPVFLGAEILSATTVSGTMVLGLMPVFIFWNDTANKQSFHFAVIGCVLIGMVYALGFDFYNPIPGKYGDLLWVNGIGFIVAILLYKIPVFISKGNGQRFIKLRR